MINQSEISDQAKHHSRLGIASVILGGILPFLLILLIIFGGVLSSYKFAAGKYFFGGFVFVGLAGPFIHLVGFCIGVGGLFSKKTKKVFPVTGAILNLLLGISGILIIIFIITNMSWGFR